MKHILFAIILGIAILSCNQENIDPEPADKAEWFPQSPENIVDLNTAYDDYNSNINVLGKRIHLYYSTNKDSKGSNFDISSCCIDAFLNLDNAIFSFEVSNSGAIYAFDLLPEINTESDEFGPFLFYSDSLINAKTSWYFMYANNENGNFDIRFTYAKVGDWGGWDSKRHISGPFPANTLNSPYDDYYPTIDVSYSKMYFSSNRGHKYDIYEIDMVSNDLVEWLQNGKNTPRKNSALSSSYDDKCPYIKGNLMVFSSNRDSGFGGYDLWYSVFENGEWSEPQNFGPEINTKYDEYRPAIEYFPDSKNDLMLFSSDRPGGKGGFDLYYAGIPKMIK